MRRSPELTPLSHDHHVALERALALRRASTDAEAAAASARFAAFLADDGLRHFEAEEQVLGPHLTGAEHARLLDEHVALRAAAPRTVPDAQAVGTLLDAHVRWEERELFPALETRLASEELAAVGRALATFSRT